MTILEMSERVKSRLAFKVKENFQVFGLIILVEVVKITIIKNIMDNMLEKRECVQFGIH